MSPARLGRGVGALFSGDTAPFERSARLVPIAHLHPNPNQPRREFDKEKLDELAASIRSYGIIQPLIVEERKHNDYIIIAGERRYRAARIVDLAEVPVICRKSGETERLELALIENVQRAALSALEEAHAYRSLLEQTMLTQEQLAKRVGKSRSALANTLRLLSLPEGVQRLLERERLRPGHARAVLVLADAAAQQRLADEIVRRQLSVRESEELARARSGNANANATAQQAQATSAPPSSPQSAIGYELAAVEGKIRDRLMTKVTVSGNSERGKITIQYHSLTDLNRIYKRICALDDE